VARNGDWRDGYEILLENLRNSERPLGRSRRRCYNCVKMGHKEIGSQSVGCIGLSQDREKELASVNAEVTFRAP